MKKRRTKGTVPRRSRVISNVAEDVAAWQASGKIDRTADYLWRGRQHKALADAALTAAWRRAVKAMAAEPFSDAARREEQDLMCELELRRLAPPFDAGTISASKAFVAAISEASERLKSDPEAFAAADEALQKDIDAFKARRDRPKN